MLVDGGHQVLRSGLTLGIIGCLDVLQPRVQRHLRVDNHLASAGEVDHHVGPDQCAFVILDRDLSVELDALAQTRRLEDGLQDQFTPVPLGLAGSAQCLGQVGGFGSERHVQVGHLLELLTKGTNLGGFGNLRLLRLGLEFGKLLAERLEECPNLLVADLGEGLRLFGKHGVGKVREMDRELFLRGNQRVEFLLMRLRVLLDHRLEFPDARLGGGEFATCLDDFGARRVAFGDQVGVRGPCRCQARLGGLGAGPEARGLALGLRQGCFGAYEADLQVFEGLQAGLGLRQFLLQACTVNQGALFGLDDGTPGPVGGQ